MTFPQKVGPKANSILFVMKRLLRSNSAKLLTIGVVCQLFQILDELAQIREPNAPVLYRLLVYNLVEGSIDLTLRETYTSNFKSLFVKHPDMPISILYEPFVRQLEISGVLH